MTSTHIRVGVDTKNRLDDFCKKSYGRLSYNDAIIVLLMGHDELKKFKDAIGDLHFKC